jgi:transposase
MNITPNSKESVYVALELSNSTWKLAFGDGKKERRVTVTARDCRGVLAEITKTKEKFGLGSDAQVYSCYEAGRDGFWIARFLESEGIDNLVVDPSSIEVNRRQRRAKTDRLDAQKLLEMLVRYHVLGTKKIWKVVRVPTHEQEDARRVHRELERLKRERTSHINRIRSLFILHGINPKRLIRRTERIRDWSGEKLPSQVLAEIEREWARIELVAAQVKVIETARTKASKESEAPNAQVVRRLHQFKGIGQSSAWLLADEFFAWREFNNRREVGSLAGLCGTPYNSGDSVRERGISKAGNRRVRTLMIEMAWRWIRFQPNSHLTHWFNERYGGGTGRMRRVGIVAVARKLLVALWKYLKWEEIPPGAIVLAR